MGKIYKCPKCNGSGKKLENEGDMLYYIGTLGFGLLVDALDPVNCPVCKGQGVLRED